MRNWRQRWFWLVMAVVSFLGGGLTIWGGHPVLWHFGHSFGKFTTIHVGGFWIVCGLVFVGTMLRSRILQPGEILILPTIKVGGVGGD